MKTIIWQQSDVIVDREVESDEIVKIISQNFGKKTIHYIWSETAIGKTSLITKVIEKYNKIDKNDLDIIRIKTKPCNDDSGDTAWYYLQEIFDGVTKYFEKLEEENGYALTFDNFLNEYNDKTVNRTRLEIGLETLFDSDSKNGLLKNICYLILKKILRLNEYSTDKFKHDISVDSVLIKINYINYIFRNRKVLLIVDNFQNIDSQSLDCFKDWIDNNDSSIYCILEFTHIPDSDTFNKQKEYFSGLGVNVIKTELEPIDKTYIIDIVHRNVKNLSNDIAFNINVINHYEEVSLGNLRELIDYSVTYEHIDDTCGCESSDNENGTYQIIHNISNQETLALLSLIIFHKGKIKRKNAEMIFFPELNISNAVHELLDLNLIDENNSFYELKHASIIDQWEKHIDEFERINTVVYGRTKNFYLGYLESSNISESNEAWRRLLYLYSKVEPFEIKKLLPQLESKIIISISPEDAWDYIKQLYEIVREDISKNKSILFRLLEICYKLELYVNGYEILCFLENSGQFLESKLLLLHKLLYLSALDQHENVVELFENIKKEMKIKTYYQILAYLHNHSFFMQHEEDAFFKKQYDDLFSLIQQRKNDYEELMREFEFRKFKSPAGWMLVLNYYRIVHYLNQAHYYLSQYQEIMKGKNEIRLSLTYNHFNKEHIFVSDETLISIDQMKINYCIYDLIDIFQNHDELYESLPLLEYYLKEVKLLKEEKILIQCILSIVPQVQLNLQEEVNIYQMSKLICYLDGLQEIFKKLMIDEK